MLQNNAMSLTLIRQCSYTTICSSFKWIEPLYFELSCTQTHRHTHIDRHLDGHEYSIVAVNKLQL